MKRDGFDYIMMLLTIAMLVIAWLTYEATIDQTLKGNASCEISVFTKTEHVHQGA